MACAFCFAVAVPLAIAQNVMGKWIGSAVINGQRYSFTMTITAGNRYVETARVGTLIATQSGTFVLSNGLMVRSVLDWNPKQLMVLDPPMGSRAMPMARPLGGSFRVRFPNANTMLLQDVNLKGTLTYQRVE
jgi:hypothetical protein